MHIAVQSLVKITYSYVTSTLVALVIYGTAHFYLHARDRSIKCCSTRFI